MLEFDQRKMLRNCVDVTLDPKLNVYFLGKALLSSLHAVPVRQTQAQTHMVGDQPALLLLSYFGSMTLYYRPTHSHHSALPPQPRFSRHKLGSQAIQVPTLAVNPFSEIS